MTLENTMLNDAVDPHRQYRTRSGLSVSGLDIKPRNGAGRLVTFPVKGSIHKPNCQPRYMIWTLDGCAMADGSDNADDLTRRN